MGSFIITGKLIDLFEKRIYAGEVTVENGRITAVREVNGNVPDQYLLPGFVDAHVHIESSMLAPAEFARLAVVHGTVATVSDPHEIANVNGLAGVQYMLDNAAKTPFKIFFGAPSCVPATFFETAGAVLDAAAVSELLQRDDIWYLSEMMNYPGVLHGDKEVLAKIAAAKKAGKPADGHAPGLTGADARKYASAGISTDHECFTLNEALGKINEGMHILIREGSAAKNYEALAALIRLHPDKVMFCSDDKHPNELAVSHINAIVKRSVANGYDLFDVLRAACMNPVLHYKIPVGLLRVHDPADFIVVNNLKDFEILKTYINGERAAENGKTLLPRIPAGAINNFGASPKTPEDFAVPALHEATKIRIIEAQEGQLVTNELIADATIEKGQIMSNPALDLLKLTVVNRYNDAAPAVAFIKNMGLKHGAIASTVAHDCHNIIATGADDASICAAVNALIACKGGIAAARNENAVTTMPLPIAGLMSAEDGYAVAEQYTLIDKIAKELGSPLHAPFMTLSFMALLVIPSLKLSDKGLFDGRAFTFITIAV